MRTLELLPFHNVMHTTFSVKCMDNRNVQICECMGDLPLGLCRFLLTTQDRACSQFSCDALNMSIWHFVCQAANNPWKCPG